MIPSFPGEECTCVIKLHHSVNFHMQINVNQSSLVMIKGRQPFQSADVTAEHM